ncbi:dTDP-4-dehydrorhamnose 3,5-epimerase [soil metagenome]
MKIITTEFKGLLVLEPRVFEDERGFFFESFNGITFKNAGLDFNFVQDNQSFSRKGVLRGLHFQKSPFAQTKLVRVLSGVIQDVVVDLRKDQPTFKKYFSVELSSENKKQFLVPKGFAHGFLVLSETATVLYKCDEYYHPEAESGIAFNDSELAIPWQILESDATVARKDKMLPSLSELVLSF